MPNFRSFCVYLFHFILSCHPAVHIHFVSSIVILFVSVYVVCQLAGGHFVCILLLSHAVFCTPFQWFSSTSPGEPRAHILSWVPWVAQEIWVGELCSLIGCWHSIVVVYKRAACLHHVFIPSHAAVVTGCAPTLTCLNKCSTDTSSLLSCVYHALLAMWSYLYWLSATSSLVAHVLW